MILPETDAEGARVIAERVEGKGSGGGEFLTLSPRLARGDTLRG